jgi:hypothetical protein
MAKVSNGKELLITMKNSLGAGATVFQALQDKNINVVASSGFQHGDEIHVSIVPDNLEEAKVVLKGEGVNYVEQDVLLVEMPNQAGAFATLLQQIAELDVNIVSAYATTTVMLSALAVLTTDNDDKVVEALSD